MYVNPKSQTVKIEIPAELSALLAEQEAYYEARANEYDERWERRGRYDLGPEGNAQWRDEIRKVQAIFDKVPLVGDILEPAGGTGNWTLYLASRAYRVRVLETSPSAIEVNRKRLQDAGLFHRVEYEIANLFHWTAQIHYDAAFLGFFFSHIPSLLADSFLLRMAKLLKPGGCLCILDGQRSGKLRSSAQGTSRLDDETELRTLNDGRQFRIVKRYGDPEDWADRLKRAGFEPNVGLSGEEFEYAIAFSRRQPIP